MICNRLKHFFPLILYLFYYQFHLFAQENFEPGYIISKTNDTLTGLIDYRDWQQGPFSIRFKSSDEIPAATVYPQTINGFAVHDKYYTTQTVWMDKSPHENESVDTTSNRIIVETTVFLQTLVSAPEGLNLYYYNDENGKKHFYCTYDEGLTELRVIKYANGKRDTVYIFNEWIFRLMEITTECQEVLNNSTHLEYTIPSLVAFFVEYNNCIIREVDYQYYVPHRKTAFGLGGGASLAKLKYSVPLSGEYFTEARYYFGNGFNAGIFFNVDLPGLRETWWFCNAFNLQYYESSGNYDEMIGLYDIHADINFKILDLKVFTAIRLQANTKLLTPYLKFGVTNSLSRIWENTTVMTNENTFSGEVDTINYVDNIQKNIYHPGIAVSGGVFLLRNFCLEFGYERGFLLANYTSVQTAENILNANLLFTIR